MTNKTIINGIDVGKCKSFFKGIKEHNICCYFDTREDKIPFAVFCEENPNCYFKQLARAKEEIEKWKHQAELGSDTTDRLSKELEELNAQVDEWKENCNNNFELVAIRTKLLTDIAIKLGLNTAIIERKDVFDKIDKLQTKEQECQELMNQRDKLEFGNNILEHERNNYKQALIEIEDYVRDNCDFDKSDKLISDTGAYDILEMIPYDIKQRTVNNARKRGEK